MPAITIDALNMRKGIEAKGLSIVNSKLLSFGKDPNKYWKVFDVFANKKNPIALIKNILLAEYHLCKRIIWCDVIIWQWDTRVYLPHFWFLKFCNKPILVEWLGSDIRVPEFVMKYNPYYKKEVDNKTYTYLKESEARSHWIQKKFKFLNAIPYLCPEMTLFLKKDLYPFYFKCFQRIDVKKFEATYPDPKNKKLIVVHTPSATGAKGTAYVREIISELKSTYEFEYVEIHNQTHQQALQAIASADIYLDQFIGGSYGMASCEAMSMGKPVFCYLMKPVVEVLPADCPLINANPDNLKSILRNYLEDGELRNKTGKLSRIYMEQYHDVHLLVDQLLNYFNMLLKKNN